MMTFIALAAFDLPPMTIFEISTFISMIGAVGVFIGGTFTLWLGTKFTSIQSFEKYKEETKSEFSTLKQTCLSSAADTAHDLKVFKDQYGVHKDHADLQRADLDIRLSKLETRCRMEHDFGE